MEISGVMPLTNNIKPSIMNQATTSTKIGENNRIKIQLKDKSKLNNEDTSSTEESPESDKIISIVKNAVESKQGYVYVMYNEVYQYYGDDVYKIGRAKNCDKRINGYVTAYIHDPIVVYKSPLLPDCVLAESLVFKKLKFGRIKNNREFFQLNLEEIKKIIDEVSNLLLEYDDLSRIDTILFNETYNNQVQKFDRMILEKFYDFQMGINVGETSISENNLDKFANLISHLQLELSNFSNGHQIEKMRTTKNFLDKMFTVIELDLQSSVFDEYRREKLISRELTVTEMEFVEKNQGDFRCYFGDVGRIWGKFSKIQHYFKLVGRLLKSYYGIELVEKPEREKTGKCRLYLYSYELKIPSDLYELLCYRILSHHREGHKWSLSSSMVAQLMKKIEENTELKWLHLWRKDATKEMLLKEFDTYLC